MNKLRLSSLLPFGNHKKDDGERSNKCAPGTSHLSNKPLKNQSREILFKKCAEQEVVNAEQYGKMSCADNYRTAVRSFLKFLDKPDIPVIQIKPALMKRYEQWLHEKDVSRNTSSCYIRSLRAIYNKVLEKYKLRDRKPFDDVFTGNDVTMKRAVEESDIVRIASLDLKIGTRLCQARDLFMFCFYAMGMPFVDVVHLKKNQIQGGVLTYHRQKTGRSVIVRIEPCAQEIIRRYNDPKSEYVFPILKGATSQERDLHYSSALGYYNILLKKIGKLAGLSEPLTSYVARHSWASLAYEKNVSINVICQALGHSSPRTTIIYIRELNQKIVFGANKKVLNGINEIKVSPLCKRRNLNCNYAIRRPKSTH
jgi:integrase